jgi:hypothetical protein
MTPEEMSLLIPQYLSGQMTPAEKDAFEAELGTNAGLRLEVDELRAVWDGLGSLPQETPSPALRARFYQKLHDIQTGRSHVVERQYAWWKPGLQGLVPQTVLALAVFVLGTYVGHVNLDGRGSSTEEVKRLGSEVQNLRQTVALSLLDQQSATSRLEGISWSSRVDRPEPGLVSALLTMVDHDPNTNVRLSALDALEKFAGDPAVRKALVDSLPRQDSPLVQIALIDALVRIRDRAAAGELRKLTGDSETNSSVRQRAQWGLEKLSL